MTREEMLQKMRQEVAEIIFNCDDYKSGKEQLNNYCKIREINCSRINGDCDNCPVTLGEDKLAAMFGVKLPVNTPVIKVDKIIVKKIGKITVNWIERR